MHDSDCSTNNGPALPSGPCDCTEASIHWNADDWHLFLCQHCDNRATSPRGMEKVALRIAETIYMLQSK
jgi:hypothetical protein